MSPTPKPKPTAPGLIKIETKGKHLLTPLEAEVKALTVSNADDYTVADTLLGDIQRARKAWDAEVEPILAPLRQAKTAADALKRKIDAPLAALETQVKAVMGTFKREEARQIAEAAAAQAREQEKLAAQVEEVSAKELNARTQQMRDRLAAKRATLETQLEETAELVPGAVKGEHSGTRTVRKLLVTNHQKLAGCIGRGDVPTPCMAVDFYELKKYLDANPDVFPGDVGAEWVDEIQIVGRRG